MTVKELIEELEKIDDKSKEVVFSGHYGDEIVNTIAEGVEEAILFG